MSELERWLTLERIAASDFAALVFQGLKSGDWSADEAMDLMERALRTFGNRCCYYLASVVAHETGLPIAGFWRRDADAPLVHALVVDPATGVAADILGARPLAEVRQEMRAAVGSVRLQVLRPIAAAEMPKDERAALALIAAGLPWMPGTLSRPAMAQWHATLRSYARDRA